MYSISVLIVEIVNRLTHNEKTLIAILLLL